MEILLTVLLLFGAFTLGSTTTVSVDADAPARAPAADGRSDHAIDHGREARLESMICRSTRAAVYRDLTVPYASPADQPAANAGDGDCGCRRE